MEITVREYNDNKEKLVVNYIPFNEKVKIVDAILEQFYKEMDLIVLKRVSEQIIIESITNIKLDEVDEETGLSGYDMMFYLNVFDSIYQSILNEYVLFEELIDLRLQQYERMNS